MRRLFFALLLLTACTSTQPPTPAAVPEWEVIPPGISAALCVRLQMDAIGSTGADISMVKVTQPIASPQALAALGKPKRGRIVRIVHRALPVTIASVNAGGCAWKTIDALDPARQHDRMVVELSAPVANPSQNAAGLVARVSLGGTHPTWYWIELNPHPGGWSVGRIFPLPL